MTLSTTTFSPGDVVLVRFLFTDMGGAKQRPAVIVSSATYHSSRPDVVLLGVTSRASQLPGDVPIVDWQSAGLVKASYLKAVVQTVSTTSIAKRLGSLSDADLANAQGLLRSILHV